MPVEDIYAAVLALISFLVLSMLLFQKRSKQSRLPRANWIFFLTVPWFLIGLLTPQYGWIATGILGGVLLLLLSSVGLSRQ